MYPVTLDVHTPEKIGRWRPLLHGIMTIPHLVVAWVLQTVANVIALISWFVILFTGNLPEGLANFQAMALRYGVRIGAFAGFLHEDYPPFDFTTSPTDPGGTPVEYSVRPALTGRNRLTVLLRFIWVIPAMLWTMLIGIVGAVCWILGFFAVIILGRWPAGLRRWVLAALRVNARTNAYAYMLTDEYPPFTAD